MDKPATAGMRVTRRLDQASQSRIRNSPSRPKGVFASSRQSFANSSRNQPATDSDICKAIRRVDVTARTYLAALRLGAVSYTNARNPLEQRLRRLSSLERKEEARAFLTLFYRESGKSISAFQKRWAEARRALNRSGAYEHTEEELAYGCRVAWRNHGRCSGRLYWESLEVFDCRLMTEPEEVLDRMGQHMRETLGDGRIRSMASVFAPVRPNALPTYIESPQITQYAGYVQPDGTVLGDRQNIEATRIADFSRVPASGSCGSVRPLADSPAGSVGSAVDRPDTARLHPRGVNRSSGISRDRRAEAQMVRRSLCELYDYDDRRN